MPHAHGTNRRIDGCIFAGIGTTAKHLGLCRKLDVDFQSDYCFVSLVHHHKNTIFSLIGTLYHLIVKMKRAHRAGCAQNLLLGSKFYPPHMCRSFCFRCGTGAAVTPFRL